ncbi:unnamed protein product [Diamesa hyperborea]
MILCRKVLVSLVNKRSCYIKTVSSRTRLYCTEKTEEKNNNSEKQQKHNEFVKKALILKGGFEYESQKDKKNFKEMVQIFENKDVHRRGHVEFIYAALKNMEAFGVHKDIEIYKALLNVMPKGKFIPENIFQTEFMHYPKQQQCIIDLLEQMEDNGVIPDYEMEDMLVNVFGRKGHPVRKFWRMMYWMPKFKNLSPWMLPNPVPDETLELAKLAVERMCSVDVLSKVSVYQTSDVESSIDDTWIVSGQSSEQKQMLKDHKRESALHIEGPTMIWLRNKSIHYFLLRGEPTENKFEEILEDEDDVSNIDVSFFAFGQTQKKNKLALKKSVHQQNDGTIYAICCTGSSTKDSLLSWIRLLENDGNENLANLAILFKLKSTIPNQLAVASDIIPNRQN